MDKIVIRRAHKPISPIPKRRDPGRRKLGINMGESNGMWKGDNVSYVALHDWVKYHLPKASSCQRCKKIPPYDLANISSEYLKDLNDWQWLCRRSHMLSDGRLHSRDIKTEKFILRERQQEIMVRRKDRKVRK
jgi:hypothetical protein